MSEGRRTSLGAGLSRRTFLGTVSVGGVVAASAPIVTQAAKDRPKRAKRRSADPYVADRFAITDVLLSYFRAIDRADADLLRACFTEDSRLDYPGPGGYTGNLDGFVSYIKSDVLAVCTRTFHFAGNMLIELEDRDRAHSETYAIAHHTMRADHEWAGAFVVMWMRYVDHWVKRGDSWLIARRHVVTEWMRKDTAGMWLDDSATTSRRDKSDPLYTP